MIMLAEKELFNLFQGVLSDNVIFVIFEFKRQINLSKVKANPYRAVLAWFKKKYSDVNDYMDFFDELAAKNAEENDMFAVPANS